MGKHRRRLSILADVLYVVRANTGAKKTQIMYQAYLSYNLLTRYLNEVLEAGLLTCDNQNYYRLTPKGQNFLSKLDKYFQSTKAVNLQVNQVKNQKIMLEKICPNLVPDGSQKSVDNDGN